MSKHCCDSMRSHISLSCDQHEAAECPDSLVVFNPKFREYGLPVLDGGTSIIHIDHCPWCGTKLPESLRDRWFEELDRLGFDDPTAQDIPVAFRSEAWYAEV
ncbi:DUF6980 family protein [Acidovorax lacteus]|uniref:DUF6980 family protein n=1 Tax=Acidovorax lacteus TaxID=1924988 RepID=UPI003CD06BE6